MAFLHSEEGAFPTKFRGKYRIETSRLQGFDYGSNGGYFVTINTKNRNPYLGQIQNGIMGLSEIGCVAWECWRDIPNHFPFVIVDEFVVMPDHVHGILFINKSVETQNFASLRINQTGNKFGPQSQNLASIIRGFKIGITKYSKKNYLNFTWQPRFHDRIIRDEYELNQIRKYIKNNPKNWGKNKYEL